jgi:methionine sulfoxide reductase heme-binding subunit
MWQPEAMDQLYWYISQTTAITAYILLFINFCLGIGMKSKYLDPWLARWRAFDLHKFTAILGGALAILHVFSLLGDSYLHFSLNSLLVPLASPYRPLWTALGVVGLYGGIVIVLSSFISKFIGQKVWRTVHYLSYVLFLAILFHGLKTGTDSSVVWIQALYIFTGSAAAFLLLWRLLLYRPPQASAVKNESLTPREESLMRIKTAMFRTGR